MRIFLAYKHTGEDIQRLEIIINKICSKIYDAGHDSFCMFLDQDVLEGKFSQKEIMLKAGEEIDKSDLVLFFIEKEEISPGMIYEAGYAKAKNKRCVLFIKSSIKEHMLKRHIDNIIEFNDEEDLGIKLRDFLKNPKNLEAELNIISEKL